jgi:hypothetical protein
MHGFSKSHQTKFQGPCCPVCGSIIVRALTGRRKKFCSDACRKEAHRANNFSTLGHCRGVRRNDAKNRHSAGTFSTENAGRGSHIAGPRDVIATELAALNWTQDPPGSATYVAQLQPRALREATQ